VKLPMLYSFRRCPYAMRARFAIAVSGQSCELREVLLRDKPAELKSASSKATVPVLVEPDGTVIDQSLDVMMWALHRNDPEGWLAAGPRGSLDDALTLIAECDGLFKQQLDRYKYPNRFEGVDAVTSRASGALFLKRLDALLDSGSYLFTDRPALADMAIAPFVRQFAQVDTAWFAAQPWSALQRWLDALTTSALWVRATEKYPAWKSGEPGVDFPGA